jgi:hypothetical protein
VQALAGEWLTARGQYPAVITMLHRGKLATTVRRAAGGPFAFTKGVMMKRLIAGGVLALAVIGVGGGVASARNRAHIVLPDGTCIVVGSEKSVQLPDGSYVDLYPETPYPSDEFGASYAAKFAVSDNSLLQPFGCP